MPAARMFRRPRERAFSGPLQRADLVLFRRAARWKVPVLEPFLPRLSHAANRSRLWMAISVLLGLLGGRFGGRAAIRGLLSVALTSFTANVPAKLLLRRARPEIDAVPVARRLARLPTSTSFPSGHAASAFAFATAASLEKPILAVPLFSLATAVAYSRVHTGVHYPSDVMAGAALGAGIAVATRRLWPVPPDEPARARPATVELHERPDPDGTGLAIVVNPSAGVGFAQPPVQQLAEALPGAEIVSVEDGGDLVEALQKTAAGCRVLGICGGDGSVNAAVRVAHAAAKPLAVFPGGTLNHFARDAGVNSIDDAVEAVRSGDAVAVDVAEIAGRPFINTASFGNYVEMVDRRERMEGRLGKWPAMVVALARVLARSEPVQVAVDGTERRVWMAFLGNCTYHPDGFHPAWRERLDDGLLDIRLVEADGPYSRLRVVWAVATGTLRRCRVYRCRVSSDPVSMRSLEGPIRLSRDGETFTGPEEFTVRKLEDPLVLLVPPER